MSSSNSNASWNYVNPWINYRSTSNTFNPSYINGYVDISGSAIVRNGFVYILTQDLSLNGNIYVGNTYVGTSIVAGNITAVNNLNIQNSGNLIINGNLAVVNNNYNYTNTINGNLYIQSSTITTTMNGNLYVNGNLSIPNGNLYVGSSTQYQIAYMKNPNNVNFGGINNILLQNINNLVSGYLAGNAINPSNVQYGSTVVGSNALQYYNTDNTVAIGSNTLNMYGNVTFSGVGSGNLTAIGANAGSIFGDTTGKLGIIKNGYNNTFIGANTGQDSSLNNWNNSTAVGVGALITANNQVVLGTSSSIVYCPNKMTIGSYNTNYNLYVNGDAYFTQDVSAASCYMRGLTISGDLYSAIQKINVGFVHSAEYIGAFSANKYFAIDCSYSTVTADPSNVLYLPNCILYQVYAQSKTNVTSATTINITQNNTIFANAIADFDANVNVTSSSNLVSDWIDTISGFDASQNNLLYQPTLTQNYINGFPAIDFSSAAGNILVTNNPVTTTTDITMFFVVKHTSSKVSQLLSTRGGWTIGNIAVNYSSLRLAIGINQLASFDTTFYATINVPYLLTINISINSDRSGAVSYSINGNVMTTYTVSSNGFPSTTLNSYFEIGGWSGDTGRNFAGGIGEFTYYNRTLTLIETQRIQGYLAWKWGLNSSLPTNHTYYSSSPSTSSGQISVIIPSGKNMGNNIASSLSLTQGDNINVGFGSAGSGSGGSVFRVSMLFKYF